MTFNDVFNNLSRLFGREKSGETAKERLRLVLMSDHLSLAPDMVEAMKRDLVEVVSRYVEVDRDKIDVRFEHQDSVFAMLANVPIISVNRTPSPPVGPPRRRRRKKRSMQPAQQNGQMPPSGPGTSGASAAPSFS
ncbi:MAG TPA: cell division topological specificity factor MinE [Candidatus Rubrimentiphilum sp.]|nr:cell division topological specificity factor MinE [Candidatus Rubrimentiphilum sp.]